MKPKHVIIMVILVSFLIQGTLFSGSVLSKVNETETTGPTAGESRVQLAGAGGEDPLVTNVIENGGFEQVYSQGYPRSWDPYGTIYMNQSAAYTTLTYAGTYSGQIVSRGTPQWSGDSSMYYYTYNLASKPYLTQGITLDLYTDVVSNPDLASAGQCYIRIQIQCPGYWRFLIYYLSYRTGYPPANTSDTTYFGLNSTLSSWQHFQRDVTADFESRFGAAPSNSYVYVIHWTVYSPAPSTGPTELVIDEVNLQNGTAYEFLHNGDFEDGDGIPWRTTGLYSPGYVYTTSDCTEGTRAANISIKALGPNGNGYAYMSRYFGYPQGLYAAQPGSAVFEFDWKYKDTYNGGSNQYAYLQFYYENSSYYGSTSIFLGQDLDWFGYSNSTNYLYLKASGFGNRGTWQHQITDVGALFQQMNIHNVDIENIQFYVYVGNYANSSVTLQLDRFQFRTYPTIDPGFEQDWYWDTYIPVPGWFRTSALYPYVNQTSEAHSGKWAANITAYDSIQAGLYRYQFVNVNESIFTDFWYQVNDITSVGANIAYIRLYFDTGFTLYYVLARSSYSVSNDSSTVYYYVTGYNQTGGWKNIVRNVKTDLEAAFGQADWNLIDVRVECMAGAGGRVSVIFDDMNFVRDTHPPNVTFVGLEGPEPTYYRQANVRIELTDLSPVNVTVYYNNGSGGIPTQAVNMGSYFSAHIPKGPYGTVVHYYVMATDSLGHGVIDDNLGIYYSYVIGDDVPPVIDSVRPRNGTIVKGLNLVKVNATDPGSGSSSISHVELWMGSNLMANDSSAPYELLWNTRLVGNGTHLLTVKTIDEAGMSSTGHLSVDVQNDVVGPSFSEAQVNPSHPETGQPVTVSIAVSDATGVTDVTLYYRIGEGSWQTLPMNPSGAMYGAVIPGTDYGKAVSFYAVAHDVFGQLSSYRSASSPDTYNVVDTIDPTIGVAGPGTHSKLIGVVRFNVSSSDSGSGLANLTLWVDGSRVDISTSTPWICQWNTGSVANGQHTIQFVAEDEAGNVASVELLYDVENPQGLDAVGYALQSFMSQFGVIVGIGTVLGLVIVVKLLMARRQTK